jgi:hypothetical protein
MAAILVPWLVLGSGVVLLFGPVAFLALAALGSLGAGPATWHLRRRRLRDGGPVLGLEGMGWSYLVLAAFIVIGLGAAVAFGE